MLKSIENYLELLVITYNNKKWLEKLINNIINNDILKDCKITIFDNNSTDGTYDFLNEISEMYKNINIIINKAYIGDAIVVKAIETVSKEYFWILNDRISIDFNLLHIIESSIIKLKYDAISFNIKKNINKNKTLCNFITNNIHYSFCIYRKNIISNIVIFNSYNNLYLELPHIPLTAKLVNENRKIFYIDENIISFNGNINSQLIINFIVSLYSLLEDKKIVDDIKLYYNFYKLNYDNIDIPYMFINGLEKNKFNKLEKIYTNNIKFIKLIKYLQNIILLFSNKLKDIHVFFIYKYYMIYIISILGFFIGKDDSMKKLYPLIAFYKDSNYLKIFFLFFIKLTVKIH